jgi:hypothetical protein
LTRPPSSSLVEDLSIARWFDVERLTSPDHAQTNSLLDGAIARGNLPLPR